MTDINPERGEVAIVLDGRALPMRPSYKAMLAIERATGSTLQSLVFRMAMPREGLKLHEMAVIVTEGIRAASVDRKDQMLDAYSQERVGELLYDGGFLAAADPIEEFLKNALSGGAKPKKEAGGSEPPSQTEPTTVG